MCIHMYVYVCMYILGGNTYKVKLLDHWIYICWNLVGNFEYSSKVYIWISLLLIHPCQADIHLWERVKDREACMLQPMESQRVRHNWVTEQEEADTNSFFFSIFKRNTTRFVANVFSQIYWPFRHVLKDPRWSFCYFFHYLSKFFLFIFRRSFYMLDKTSLSVLSVNVLLCDNRN